MIVIARINDNGEAQYFLVSMRQRVKSMAVQGITFSACNNTIKKFTKKKGKAPELVEGVQVVPAGVVRILELQEQGYAYLRP